MVSNAALIGYKAEPVGSRTAPGSSSTAAVSCKATVGVVVGTRFFTLPSGQGEKKTDMVKNCFVMPGSGAQKVNKNGEGEKNGEDEQNMVRVKKHPSAEPNNFP